jgi:hypothetical protein
MWRTFHAKHGPRLKRLAALVVCTTSLFAADVADELRLLKEQNQKLQDQLNEQRSLIEQLRRDVRGKDSLEPISRSQDDDAGLLKKPFGKGNLVISGEGGVAFFRQGSNGQFPNSEFRLDEAKLFLDVKLWEDVYLFTELNITEREEPDKWLYVGELYVDFEQLAKRWNERWLNVRVGRFDTPFGEEYLRRDAIDNALISHSLSDIWGVDEGIELYGSINKFRYVLAVQNGGIPNMRDYTSDKAVIAKVGYRAWSWLDLSASAMRTGAIDSANDTFSAVWFGNGFFRNIAGTASRFDADLVEGDIKTSFSKGYLLGAGGYVHTADLNPTKNQRDIYYYFLEGSADLTHRLYTAARVSQLFVNNGYPLVGAGNFGARMFGPATTEELWRLSLGVGFRWSKDLVTKLEYAFNGGKEVGGRARTHEDFLAFEVSLKF